MTEIQVSPLFTDGTAGSRLELTAPDAAISNEERCVIIDHGFIQPPQASEALRPEMTAKVATKAGEIATISVRDEKPRCHKRSPRRMPRRF